MNSMFTLPLAFQMPSMIELLVIGLIGLLFFGKRLPEVGKSVARGIVEFKKGLKGVEDDVDAAGAPAAQPQRIAGESTQALPGGMAGAGAGQPRFDPYTGKPLQPAFDPYTGKPLSETSAQ